MLAGIRTAQLGHDRPLAHISLRVGSHSSYDNTRRRTTCSKAGTETRTCAPAASGRSHASRRCLGGTGTPWLRAPWFTRDSGLASACVQFYGAIHIDPVGFKIRYGACRRAPSPVHGILNPPYRGRECQHALAANVNLHRTATLDGNEEDLILKFQGGTIGEYQTHRAAGAM